jgi:HEPN pEK499 p136
VQPKNQLFDMMERTMSNLDFIEKHKAEHGPFEVTQLINSFLGAMVHPWEELVEDFDELSLETAEIYGWPHVTKQRDRDQNPDSLKTLLRWMRNGIAHGNLKFIPDQNDQIEKVEIWNIDDLGRRNWGAVLHVNDLRQFLQCFVKEAKALSPSA